jgi:hypothetical protein
MWKEHFMSQLLSLRQCARHLGISYSILVYYRMRMTEDFPMLQVGPSKLVDPEVVRRKLIEAGYRFKTPAPQE